MTKYIFYYKKNVSTAEHPDGFVVSAVRCERHATHHRVVSIADHKEELYTGDRPCGACVAYAAFLGRVEKALDRCPTPT